MLFGFLNAFTVVLLFSASTADGDLSESPRVASAFIQKDPLKTFKNKQS